MNKPYIPPLNLPSLSSPQILFIITLILFLIGQFLTSLTFHLYIIDTQKEHPILEKVKTIIYLLALATFELTLAVTVKSFFN